MPRLIPLATGLALASLPLSAALSAQEPLFDAALYVLGSDHGEFRGHGDFNNDGHVDLVHTTNWLNWSGVTLFLGDGTGAFTPQTETVFPPSFTDEYAERDPAIGDFDGDGNLDVAFDRNSFTNLDGIDVYFGDGAGGLTGPLQVGLGNFVAALYTGEIDGDAGAEILVKHDDLGFQDHYTWLNWNGTGFSLSASLPVGGAPDPDGAFVESLGDFDGDGDDDIIATSTAPYSLVRIFPTVAGDPTYGPSFSVPAELHNVNHRIKAGDLDGDGDIDAVHLKMETSDIGPWIQTYENVGGTLVQRPAQNVPTPETGWFQPHRLILGDWDGDGWMDLFGMNFVIDAVRSNGDWTFSEGFELGDLGQAIGGGPVDVDGDGFTDYVGTRTVHRGDGSWDQSDQSLPGVTNTYLDGMVPADFEGDGDVDLIGLAAGGRALNNGAGEFTPVTGPGGLFTTFFPPPPAAGFSYGLTVAYDDFNGDGRRDYLVQLLFNFSGFPGFVEMRLLVDDGTGAFVDAGVAAPALVQIPQADQAPDEWWEAADADGDGDLDLLVQNGYWRNNGTGFFDVLVATPTGRAFSAADVDGDGDTDLLARRSAGAEQEIVLFLNDGGGYTVSVLGSLPGDPQARLVDLDDDGDLDAIAGDPAGNQVLIAEDQGASFGAAFTLAGQLLNARMIGLVDADADGDRDLLLTRVVSAGLPFGTRVVTEYRRDNGATLAYTAAREYLAPVVFEGFLDADGDGDLDMVGDGISLGATVTLPESGKTEQFGVGLAGTGDATPVLGAFGPPTSTNPAAEMRVVQAVGAGTFYLVFGLGETAITDFPLAGMTLYVDPPTIVGPLPMSGLAGAAGQGEATLALPQNPALFGLPVVHQAFVLDPGSPVGWTSSNALRITYGQ